MKYHFSSFLFSRAFTITLSLTLCMSIPTVAQEAIDLQDCYEWLQVNHPFAKTQEIASLKYPLLIDNLSKSWLPQVRMMAQASYYSKVTELPDDVPGISFEALARDQYVLQSEIEQLIYDGGTHNNRSELLEIESDITTRNIDAEMDKLKNQVIDWYFTILLTDAQIEQLDLVTADIDNQINSTRAAVESGVALQSNLDRLVAEKLTVEQQKLEWYSTRNASIKLLSILMGHEISEYTQFNQPNMPARVPDAASLQRAELQMLDLQKTASIKKDDIRLASNKPTLTAFMNLGYGRPALDFLKNEFDGFYYGGLRLTWPISNWYTNRNDRQLHSLEIEAIENERDLFLKGLDLEISRYASDFEKYSALIFMDQDIVELRTRVKQRAQSQYENGVIRASDYIQELHLEEQAQVQLRRHELALLKTIELWKNALGNSQPN